MMNCQTVEDVFQAVKDRQISFIQICSPTFWGPKASHSAVGIGRGHDRGRF
jgi:hypothetical protein